MQKLHLVIDLDATFVSSYTDTDSSARFERALARASAADEIAAAEELRTRVHAFPLIGRRALTILRPGAADFIEFASLYFKTISVWSAGQADYVSAIVDLLFPPHIARAGVVFTWGDCREENELSSDGRAASPSHSDYKPFTKPLSEFFKHVTGGQNESNTLILDDRDDIAKWNPDNLIHLPPFEPRLSLSRLIEPDHALEQFAQWLMSPPVLGATDIRRIDKSRIFR